MHHGTLLAAVDLGSNSFRLEIGRFEHGHIQRVEYRKETVRQGADLDADQQLSRQVEFVAELAQQGKLSPTLTATGVDTGQVQVITDDRVVVAVSPGTVVSVDGSPAEGLSTSTMSVNWSRPGASGATWSTAVAAS